VRLVTTTEKNVAGSLGYNEILLYFGQGPVDDPLDFGKFKAACVRAQYVKGSFKFPADGKVSVTAEDFMDLPELYKRRLEAEKDPTCRQSPPDPACSDPCKGAALP
jgi:hypothetical protein